jgi:hypothetical protein
MSLEIYETGNKMQYFYSKALLDHICVFISTSYMNTCNVLGKSLVRD